MKEVRRSIDLFGIKFSTGNGAEILDGVRRIVSFKPRLVVTANVEHVVTLQDEATFRTAYAHAAARTLDGMPLVWLARLRGHRAASRVTGHDLLDAVFDTAARSEDRIYLVSPSEATALALTKRLVATGVPQERIAFSVPPFGFERDEKFGAALAGSIRQHGTAMLLMGVGAPKSEIWAHRQGAALGAPIVLCIGEALNVAAGLMGRAPVWMQRLGLEWLFRFGTQPGRLFNRYFVRSWRFLVLAGLDRNLGRDIAQRG